MQNVNITTAVTEILPEANRSGASLFIQNQSDTTLRLAFGTGNVAQLTASLGIVLEAGESMTVDGATVSRKIAAIHGGSGSKVAHWQLV